MEQEATPTDIYWGDLSKQIQEDLAYSMGYDNPKECKKAHSLDVYPIGEIYLKQKEK